EAEGFEVIRIAPDMSGKISVSDIAQALNDKTVLLSFMMVNNELGAISPIAEISRLLKRTKSSAVLHCDAVQALGKLPVRVRELGCDLLSMSGHKIHAPKGVGALYCRKGVRIAPITYGGNQQDKLRPGTEPLPSIAAFAEAIRQLPPMSERLTHLSELNAYLRRRLAEDELNKLAPITINSPDDGVPNILSVATGCIKSETLLNFLSERGVYVSSGSACSKGKASHVLLDAGIPAHIADSTIRVSFSNTNTAEDIDALIDGLYDALRRLARFR
ncbi:MAG: aminotransferase class V-fold PLP-dependent enzyme, partial [Clostridia bacterium]|nr:aminotransferase class V-fold PLP-dependent enzyme [Clostridia bacterium]